MLPIVVGTKMIYGYQSPAPERVTQSDQQELDSMSKPDSMAFASAA
jgi:hypothetical protein